MSLTVPETAEQPHVPALLWRRLPHARHEDVHRRATSNGPRGGPLDSPAERFLVRIPRPAQHHQTAALDLPVPSPDAVCAVRRTLTVILEVWAWRRPLSHLEGLLDPTVTRYTGLVAQRLHARNVRVATLNTMRICHPHPSAIEVAAVCHIGSRPRALAARFERGPGGARWCCRVLQLG